MNEWKSIKLGDLGKISMCKRVLKEQTSINEEIPFYKISTFGSQADTFISRTLFEKFKNSYSYPNVGDILISAAGTLGKTVVYDGKPAYFQDSNIVWVANNENIVLNKYLYYFYQTNPWLKTTGSTINRLYNEDIRNIKISFPRSTQYQNKVATVLSTLDEKIALNNQINATLEQMAKTLYDYWFVQFDFPDDNGKPYKSSGGEMVYNETLKREIPKGWEVKKIDDVMRIVRGASPRPIDDFIQDSGIPWIKISDATSTHTPFIFETKQFIKESGKEFSRYLSPNTLILSNSASPGIPKIVQINCCVHDGWLIVDSFKENLFNEFMYFYFLNFKNKIENMGSGSVFKNLKTEYIKDLDIVIPSDKLLNKSKLFLESIFTKLRNSEKEILELTKLRDWLLPMLMNGQVTVQ